MGKVQNCVGINQCLGQRRLWPGVCQVARRHGAKGQRLRRRYSRPRCRFYRKGLNFSPRFFRHPSTGNHQSSASGDNSSPKGAP